VRSSCWRGVPLHLKLKLKWRGNLPWFLSSIGSRCRLDDRCYYLLRLFGRGGGRGSAQHALSGSVKLSVFYAGIPFPEVTVLIFVGVCLGIGVVANALHALWQATLDLVGLILEGDACAMKFGTSESHTESS
jgi:hypothetical protein